MAVLPQRHQLHQLSHSQHGKVPLLKMRNLVERPQFASRQINSSRDLLHTLTRLFVRQLSKMRPEEYRSIIKRLETHYQDFQRNSQGSELFGEEDKRDIQGHFDKAQNHYDQLIIQLPTYSEYTKYRPAWLEV